MTEHDSRAVGSIHRDLHEHLPSDPALRVKALESVLVAKGMLDPRAVDAWIELYADEIGPKRGARVIARAWLDASFRARLLREASDALADFGFDGWGTAHVRVVENTEAVHNLVVCTLCSCYPHAVLGIPPAWYKSAPYRARAVRDPRGVLAEFGFDPPREVEIRVWDSTSEFRYMVLPRRPAGTEGWSEHRLAAIVTRNAMIGTEPVKVPA